MVVPCLYSDWSTTSKVLECETAVCSDWSTTSEALQVETAASSSCPDRQSPCSWSRLVSLSKDSPSWRLSQSIDDLSVAEVPRDWAPRPIRLRRKLCQRRDAARRRQCSLLELPTKMEPDPEPEPEPEQARYVGATG